MSKLLELSDCNNVVVVVSRWYGGVKLGADRWRLISSVAKEAVAAHRQLKGIKVFQTIFSSTLASSVAVSSVIFFFLFNPAIGTFQVNWRNEQGMAMFAAVVGAAVPGVRVVDIATADKTFPGFDVAWERAAATRLEHPGPSR